LARNLVSIPPSRRKSRSVQSCWRITSQSKSKRACIVCSGLASYGLKAESLPNILKARNITLAGGQLDLKDKSVSIDPSGEFRSEQEIGDVTVGISPYGSPLYLHDFVDTFRAYDSPPRYLSYYSWRDPQDRWQRTRAIVLSIQMGAGQQIISFAQGVDTTLAEIKARLPKDLIITRTSDQPQQVEENVELFMNSLYEAIVLVVVVSFIGFWEWRSALLMALAIPLTLLMTFGMAHVWPMCWVSTSSRSPSPA
jgi:multidrug efflux pump